VPVDDLRIAAKVLYLDSLGLALAHAKERARHLPVIGEGSKLMFGRGFERVGAISSRTSGGIARALPLRRREPAVMPESCAKRLRVNMLEYQ